MHFESWLTLNLINFLNVMIHLPFLELSIIIFRNIKMGMGKCSASIKEPSQTARMCKLAWLYIGGKGLSIIRFQQDKG